MLGLGVTAVMIVVECLDVGVTTILKAAMNVGTSYFVFPVYTNAFAATFIFLPSSLIFYRKRSCHPLSMSIICRIFVLSLINCCLQTFSYIGLEYSSPTLASAIGNLTPVFTFILSIISRMEKLDLRVQISLAKATGTIVSIAGALTVTLYKGLAITSTSSPKNKLHESLSLQTNWISGGLFLIAASFLLALLFVVQASIIKAYPEELMVTFIACIFVTIHSSIVAIAAVRDPNAWRLQPDMELIAIGCSAVFSAALRNLVHTWAIHKKGPVYVSMFKPLAILIAIVLGVTFLGDTVYIGSVVGAFIIAVGFYSVIWGQAQEEMRVDDKGTNSLNPSSHRAPLLEDRMMEE